MNHVQQKITEDPILSEITTSQDELTDETHSLIQTQIESISEDWVEYDESYSAEWHDTKLFLEEIVAEEELIVAESDNELNNQPSTYWIPVVMAQLYVQHTVRVYLMQMGIKKLKPTIHLGVRMLSRDISPKRVYEAIRYGKRYYDPAHNSTVYYYKGVAVAQKKTGR